MHEGKQLILEMIKRAGSMEYTLSAIRCLEKEVEAEVDKLERETGIENWELRVLVRLLKV